MKYYLSCFLGSGQLSYLKPRADGKGNDTFVEAPTEAEAIATFKIYVNEQRAWLTDMGLIDENTTPGKILINSEGNPAPRLIDW